MPEIAIVSDTHCYHDADSAVPSWVRETVAAADLVVHAGDFVTGATLEFFRDLSTDLLAVRGNSDVAGVDLPTVASRSVGGVTIGVTHPLGVEDASLEAAAYRRTVVDTVREHAGPDAIAIAGHTHRVIDAVEDGTRLLNPGSPTAALPADRATMLVATAADGTLDVTVHEGDGEGRVRARDTDEY